MMESAIRLYAWNLSYAKALVEDLSESQVTESLGAGLENHPAWTIGHLVTGSDILAVDLGLSSDLPDRWRDLFQRRGPGDSRLPDTDPDVYPPLETLIAELGRQHARVEKAWRDKMTADGTNDPELEAPIEWRFGEALPTLGDVTLFLAVSHEAMHLGQLAAWRRARGLPSALATL